MNSIRETPTPLAVMAFRWGPELRADIEAVARPDETISDVIRAALVDLVEARRHAEQIAARKGREVTL